MNARAVKDGQPAMTQHLRRPVSSLINTVMCTAVLAVALRRCMGRRALPRKCAAHHLERTRNHCLLCCNGLVVVPVLILFVMNLSSR